RPRLAVRRVHEAAWDHRGHAREGRDYRRSSEGRRGARVGRAGRLLRMSAGRIYVDMDLLREQVKEKYREVATDPHQELHFHTGLELTRRLGYDDADVASLPRATVDSFAGVGNPFAMGKLSPGQ